MIRKFLTDSVWYTVSTILSKSILIILLPIITRFYSPQQFGIIDSITIIGALLPAFFSLEIYQGFARLFPEMKNADRQARLVSSNLSFVLLSNLVLLVLMVLCQGPFLHYIGFANSSLQLALLVGFTVVNSYFYTIAAEQLRWMQMVRQYTATNLCFVILFSGLLLGFLYLGGPRLEWYFLSQLGASLLSFCLGLYFQRRYLRRLFDFSLLPRLLKFSAPLVLSTLAFNGSLYVDRIIVKSLLGNAELGILGIAMRTASVISVLIVAFQGPLMPIIYKDYQNEGARANIRRILNLFLFIFSLVAVNVTIFSDNIILLVSNAEYKGAAVILPLVAFKVFFAQSYVFAPGLAIAKKTKAISLLFLFYLLLNLISLPLYAQTGQLLWVTLGATVNAFVFFAVYYHISSRDYNLQFNLGRIGLLLLLLASLLVLANRYLYQFENSFSIFAFKMLLSLLVSVLILTIIFDKQERRSYRLMLAAYLNRS